MSVVIDSKRLDALRKEDLRSYQAFENWAIKEMPHNLNTQELGLLWPSDREKLGLLLRKAYYIVYWQPKGYKADSDYRLIPLDDGCH